MKVIDTYNALVGSVVAVLTYIFGEHWLLFALLDEKPHDAQRKLYGRLERRPEKAGILAYDCGGIWSERSFY